MGVARFITSAVLAVAGGALLAIAATAAPASAQTTIGTFEGSIPIETLQGSGVAINRIVVEAQEAGSVVIGFDDVVLSEKGVWEAVEAGSTPYTLQSRILPDPAVIRYEGDMVGQQQTFEVALRTSGLDGQPRAGFITYTFVPDTPAGTEGSVGIRESVAVRVRLGTWPSGLDAIPVRVSVSDLRLERDRDAITGLIDRLLPELPRVLNRGPAVVGARTTNVGDALVQSGTTLTLTRLPWIAALPFVDPEGSTVITLEDRAQLLLPGEGRTSTVASTASLNDGEDIDRLPLFGLVRISATSTAFLGASSHQASATAVHLIAPWKESLLIVRLVLGVRAVRRRRTDRTDASDEAAPAADPEAVMRATGQHTTLVARKERADPEGDAILADVALADKTVWAPADAAFDALGDAIDTLPTDEVKRILPTARGAGAGSVFMIDTVITAVAVPSLPARVGNRLVRALLHDDVRFVIWPTAGAVVIGGVVSLVVQRSGRRR